MILIYCRFRLALELLGSVAQGSIPWLITIILSLLEISITLKQKGGDSTLKKSLNNQINKETTKNLIDGIIVGVTALT